MDEIKHQPNLASNVNPVEITNETLKTDSRLNELLRELGERLAPTDTAYMGSFATHVYATTDLLGINRSIQCAHQQVGSKPGHAIYETVSESVVKTALILQKDQIMREMTGKFSKTRNKEDKRS